LTLEVLVRMLTVWTFVKTGAIEEVFECLIEPAAKACLLGEATGSARIVTLLSDAKTISHIVHQASLGIIGLNLE
jgi:hypothetical protein